jgi:hypothetical protein
MTNLSVFRGVLSSSMSNGIRFFFFNNQVLQIRLLDHSNNKYYAYNTTKMSFPNQSFTDIVRLSQSSSFTYSQGESVIYGFCYNLTEDGTVGSCPPIVVCGHPNCLSCFFDQGLCSSCVPGYILYNFTCYQANFCQLSNCQICLNQIACILCNQNFTLDFSAQCV